jgi:uncharacterized protein (DUF169 family)
MNAGRQLQELLGLRRAPVGVSFRATAPAGLPRVAAAGPSSCAYWKLAAEGKSFWTAAEDHYNCPIGAYTHGVDAPAQVKKELEGVVTTMLQLGYLRAEEVPGIPHREQSFGVAVYAPLADVDEVPDVVLVAGNARQMMLLSEAAMAAELGTEGPMGRPTCAALPEAMRSGRGVVSLGCIGNRVYMGLDDDEMYFALPGKDVAAVAEKLAGIVAANGELEKYHRGKLAAVGR